LCYCTVPLIFMFHLSPTGDAVMASIYYPDLAHDLLRHFQSSESPFNCTSNFPLLQPSPRLPIDPKIRYRILKSVLWDILPVFTGDMMCILVQTALFPLEKGSCGAYRTDLSSGSGHVYGSNQISWSARRPMLHLWPPKGRAILSIEDLSAYFGFLCHGKVVSINVGPTPKVKALAPRAQRIHLT
jgi:hypothetical protein